MMGSGPAVLEYGQGDTWQIGGSRFALQSNYAYNPIGYGPTAQGIPYALPSVPPVYGQSGAGQGGGTMSAGETNAIVAASANPLHPKWSPLPWVLGGIFTAVLALHWLHWSQPRREEEAA